MLGVHSNTDGRRPIVVDGRVIGILAGNEFVKKVVGSKHRLRCPPAWAIDADVFDTEIRPNTTRIVVIDSETDVKYRVSAATFDTLKGELDRGFGRQYFLPLQHWQVEQNGTIQLALWEGE